MTDETIFTSQELPSGSGVSRTRQILAAVAVVALLTVVGAFAGLWWYAERQLQREPIAALDNDENADGGSDVGRLEGVKNFLVVGSDSRTGLSAEEVRELRLGDFDHAQADTILLIQVHGDEEVTSIVSIPRDLLVHLNGRQQRINAALDIGGPDLVVRTVEDITGVKVDHYIEVSITAFIEAVDAVGTVEICLEEPLRDRRAGADFSAGCHAMDGVDSLAFVRSRVGQRGDFRRIERQQKFIRAVIDEVTAARTLLNIPKVFGIIDSAAPHVRTDEGLGLLDMQRLARQLEGLVDGELTTTVVPAYPEEIGGAEYMIAYDPGAESLFASLRAGEPAPGHGPADAREETTVGIWSAHLAGAGLVESALYFAGFDTSVLGPGPLDGGARTVAHAVGQNEEPAEWVAAMLGADVRPLPGDVEPPEGVDVVVVIGEDATW